MDASVPPLNRNDSSKLIASRQKILLASLLILFLPTLSYSQLDLNRGIGVTGIREESLRANLQFLASSELEGRETTYRGQKVAALYISTYFQRLGLKPIGGDGRYFQRFHVEVSRPGKDLFVSVKRKSEEEKVFDKQLKDFYFFPRGQKLKLVTAPLAFVGYGIESPETEFNYNDYDQIDVTGKIVLMMAFEPQEKDTSSRFNGARPTKFSGRRGQQIKTQIAKERGAVGVLYLPEIGDRPILAIQARMLGDFLRKGVMTLPDSAESEDSGIPVFAISREVANELLRPSGKTIDQLHKRIDQNLIPASFDVPQTEVALNVDVTRELVETENVLGLLEGSDPALKDEVVIFSAHYDHLGVGSDGSIYHGADDDGSGTVALLEIATAYARNPQKPRRSMVFIAFTAEEKGLLGSRYYTNKPIIPLERTVANLNIDMIGRIDPNYETSPDSANYVYVIGADKLSSDVKTQLEQANAETVGLKLDYRYDDENDPNQFYRRSDHFNFARKGIPIAFFFSGTHRDYHRPTDTVEKINFKKMAKTVKLIWATGWKIANADHPPVINGNLEIYR